MKDLFLFINFLLISMSSISQSLLPNRTILENTFLVINNDQFGTCFTAFYQNQEYLITAKHLFQKTNKSGDTTTIQVLAYNSTITITTPVYFHPNSEIDIAVLKLNTRISKVDPLFLLDAEKIRFSIGQNCYFLGFPLGFHTQLDQGQLPIVKGAIISALRKIKASSKLLILLDGHNNSGFSGGPVVATNEGVKEQFIIGLISGYYPDPHPIEIPSEKGNARVIYNSNSGIIISYPIDFAIEIIKRLK